MLIINLFSRGIKKNLALIIFLSIISSICVSIVSWNTKKLIDGVSLRYELLYFYKIILVIFCFELIFIVLMKINNYCKQILSYDVSYVISKKILSKMAKINLKLLETPDTYNLIERINNHITENIIGLIMGSLEIFNITANLIACSFLLYKINIYFPFIAILTSIPYFILLSKQGFDNYLLETEQNKDSRRLIYLYNMLTTRNFAKEIRLYGLIDLIIKRANEIRERLWNKKFHLIVKYSAWTIVINILKNISICICLFITCKNIIHGKARIGDIVLVINSVGILTNNSVTGLSLASNFKNNILYVKDFERFLNLEEEIKIPQENLDGYEIIFDDVSFSYDAKSIALKNICVDIRPNEIVALVGENGSGKTTFMSLLLGIFQPDAGKIYIGGKNLNRVLTDFRRQSSFIFQDFLRYQMTIRDNLIAGNVNHNLESYDKTFLDFVEQFENKLDATLGQLDENAKELSGGQWQRLAISRALVRRDAKFLIMDEPTSSLDPKIEIELYHKLKRICKGKTCVISSHRLSITKICDKIYVFDKGKIVEMGSHKQLIDSKGKYYQMYEAQRKLYT